VRPFLDKSYIPDFEAYCPFGGMQSLASYFSVHSLACSMTTVQIALGIALILAVVLFSKLFCSYICPIGTFTEWMGTLGRKAKMHITLTGNTDRILRMLKYVLLYITFYFTVTASELFCRKFDPFYAAYTGFSGDVV
jgi:polyferredoxin